MWGIWLANWCSHRWQNEFGFKAFQRRPSENPCFSKMSNYLCVTHCMLPFAWCHCMMAYCHPKLFRLTSCHFPFLLLTSLTSLVRCRTKLSERFQLRKLFRLRHLRAHQEAFLTSLNWLSSCPCWPDNHWRNLEAFESLNWRAFVGKATYAPGTVNGNAWMFFILFFILD